jgi:predicted AlkP superfamily phosphohydrolase/phosphomutase
LCDRLKEELLALKNVATGGAVVSRVLYGDHLFSGEFRDEYPDLVVEWNTEAPIPAVYSQTIGEVRVESCSPRTGDHRPKGLVLVRSPDLKPQSLPGAIPLVALAPTLAARLGVQLSGIDGTAVAEFLPVGHCLRET